MGVLPGQQKRGGKPGHAGNPAKYVKMQDILHNGAACQLAPANYPRPRSRSPPPGPAYGPIWPPTAPGPRRGYAVKVCGQGGPYGPDITL